MGLKKDLIVCGTVVTIIVTGINVYKLNNKYDVKTNLDGIVVKYKYENNEIEGSFDYGDVESYLRIVKFEADGIEFTKLVTKDINKYNGRYTPPTTEYIYTDLETGTVLKKYTYPTPLENSENKNITHKVGYTLKVVEENHLLPYLIQEDNIKTKYSAKELVDFYNEKVVPTLDKEKVLVK